MNAAQLKYLRTVNKHLGGPLRSHAADKMTEHLLHASFGVLSRVIVNAEDAPSRLQAFKAAAQRWRAPLAEHLPPGSNGAALVERLATLAASEAVQDPADLEAVLAPLVALLGSEGDSGAQQLVLEIVEQEWQKARKIEDDVTAICSDLTLTNQETAETSLDAEQRRRLIELLQEQCGESAELAITNVKLNPGGFSKETLFVDLSGNRVLPDRIVLRRDRPGSPLDTSVVSEFPLLQVLHRRGVKVPQPYALDADGRVADGRLIAVSRLPGRIIADGISLFETHNRAGCAFSLAAEMAKYHTIPVDCLPAGLACRDRTNTEAMRADLEDLRVKWQACGMASVAVEAAFNWLFAHLHQAGDTRCLVHGDMRLHNALVEAEDVTGILDWELAALGNPAFDLSYAYHHVTQLVPWQRFLEAYAAAGGQVPSAETLAFYLIRTELFIVVNMSRMEAAFLAGHFDSVGHAYASIHFTQHARYLLVERLRRVLLDPSATPSDRRPEEPQAAATQDQQVGADSNLRRRAAAAKRR